MLPECKSIASVAKCFLRGEFSVVPLKSNSKEPAIRWKDYAQQQMNVDLVRDFFKENSNIAVVAGEVSGVTVLDIDDLEKFKKFHSEIEEVETTVIKTPNGYHYWFKYEKDLTSKQYQKLGFDLKNDNCLITVPPSTKNGVTYEFLKVAGLKEMPEDLKHKIMKLQEGQRTNINLQLDLILSRLRIARHLPDGTYRCYCPAHDDNEPSLDVGLRNGKIYLKCWAGCSEKEILEAIGIEETAYYENRGKESISQKLLNLAENFELWLDQNNEPFASIKIDGTVKSYRIESREFRKLLQFNYFQKYNKPAHSQAIQEAIETLCGKAIVQGKKHECFKRIGAGEDFIEVNLGNGKVVKITKEEISISEPTLKFENLPNILPLPVPELNIRGDEWEVLKRIINADEERYILTLAWLLGTFNVRGEYPILNVVGEREGVGKSTVSRLLKRIVDPTISELKPLPKTERDLLALCLHNHILAFDNLSYISENMSDALCRVSTGGALANRKLFTDKDAVEYSIKNPLILNGINLQIDRKDLRRRTLQIELAKPSQIKPIDKLMKEFEMIHPSLLGWLCKAVQIGLNEDVVEDLDLTDLASFTRFVLKTEKIFPVNGRTFIEILKKNRVEATLQVILENPIAEFLQDLLKDKEEWYGSTRELFEMLLGKFQNTSVKEIPKDVPSFGRKLKRMLSDLETIGIAVNFSRNEKTRLVHIRKIEKVAVSPVSPVISSDKSNSYELTGTLTGMTGKSPAVRLPSAHKSLKNKENDSNDSTDSKNCILSKMEYTKNEIKVVDYEDEFIGVDE